MVKKSASDASISSGTHGQYSILQTAKLLPGAPQQPPKARTGISKPYNVKQIKTTNAQEAEAAIRCLLEASGGVPESAPGAIPLRNQGSSKPEATLGPPALPRRPAPRVPTMKKPTLRRTGKPMLPEEHFEPQPVHFTMASQEMNLETPPPITATPIPPVPKPRTLQPGKGVEGRPSSGKPEPDEAPSVTGTVESPPPEAQEAPSLAPKVPPRRKKSAPAAFHLQVLQNNSQVLQGLTCSSSSPPSLKPDTHPLCLQVALGTSSARSPETHGPRVTEPEAASFHGNYPDPFWSLLHHPKLLNNTWLSKSSEPLDVGSRNPERTHTEPAQVNASLAERGLPPDHGGKDLSHWVTASNKDKRTTLGV